ncbi:MAG: sigma-54-dependent Fis family transcriptional regulator [Desulfuromonas sp.]|nr:MAG: sigma-54-dependent Fis family transcriptional regulator [Desulfuromonas sp.]
MIDDILYDRHDHLVRAPDLIVSRLDSGLWRIEGLSTRLQVWLELGDLELRGLALDELLADVSPNLGELAREALDQGRLSAIPVRFLGPRELSVLVDVEPGGYSVDDHQRQVLFYCRPLPSGQALRHEPNSRFGLVGASSGMREVYRKIELYAPSDAAVIITGETGTGKELVARALHEQSPRQKHPFVAVNCSAISRELLESELFGHEKGAFTGAVRPHRGRFERANGGTIFLDEIGDMPAHAQVKLLRILETGSLERVGSEREVDVDVRVVGATNVPLEQAVRHRQFRDDLYHRLAVLRIHLPPLRQRQQDIPLLVGHFLEMFRRKYRRPVERLTNEAMALLQAYLWPGNVRELRNVLERVFIETQAEVIGARAFREWVHERQDFSPGDWGPQSLGDSRQIAPPYPLSSERILLPESMASHSLPLPRQRRTTQAADLDQQAIRQAYRQAGGNLAGAARQLGIHRATLYRYLKRMGLDRSNLEQEESR